MKFIFIIFFIFFANFIYANEENNSEVEVINLYESKTLDQMVLENLNDEEDIGRTGSTHFLVKQKGPTLDDLMPFG